MDRRGRQGRGGAGGAGTEMAAHSLCSRPDLCHGDFARWSIRRRRTRQPDFRVSPADPPTGRAPCRPRLGQGQCRHRRLGASRCGAVAGVQPRWPNPGLRRVSRGQALAATTAIGERTAQPAARRRDGHGDRRRAWPSACGRRRLGRRRSGDRSPKQDAALARPSPRPSRQATGDVAQRQPRRRALRRRPGAHLGNGDRRAHHP